MVTAAHRSRADEVSNWLTPDEAAAILHVHPATVLRWCKEGKLVHTRVSRTYRISRSDLAQHIQGGELGAAASQSIIDTAVHAAQITAIASLKGGVAKTTTVLALADALSRRGHQVLMVDMDPQGSLTVASGLRLNQTDRRAPTIGAALEYYAEHRQPQALEDYRHRLGDRLDLLPATLHMHLQERALSSAHHYEFLLAEALMPAIDQYDVILIDCSPSASTFTTMALTAAQSLIVPVTPEYLSAEGLALLFIVVQGIRLAKLNPDLSIDGVILTMTDRRTTHAREMETVISRYLASLSAPVPILGEARRSVKVADATAAHQPVTRYAPDTEVARSYEQIAERLLTIWRKA